jgi:hypothetical protein
MMHVLILFVQVSVVVVVHSTSIARAGDVELQASCYFPA